MIIIQTDIHEGKINPKAGIAVKEYAADKQYQRINLILEEVEKHDLFFKPITAEKLKEDYEHYNKLVNQVVADSDVSMLLNHSYEIQGWVSYGATMQGSALLYLNAKRKFAVLGMPEELKTLSATVQNQYIKGETGEYEAFYETISRLNASAQHKVELMRTHISFEKSLMSNK